MDREGKIPNPGPINDITTDDLGNPLPIEDRYYDYREFGTDNRNAPMKGGSARQWSYAEVDICNEQTPLVDKKHGIGESHSYRLVTDKNTGKLVEVEEKKTASGGGMSETVSRSGDNVVVNLKGATSIPFVKGSPDIDYDYTIVLWKEEGDKVVYRVSGEHDGFPAYEIFIGSVNVYFHTPKINEGQNPLSPFNAGQSLASLLPPAEFKVSKNGEIAQAEAYAPL